MRPLGLVLLLLSGCSETGLSFLWGRNAKGTPDIEVDPSRLDFGAARFGSSVHGDVTIRNIGRGPLHVDTPMFPEGPGAFSVVDPQEMVIEPDQEFVLDVVWTPATPGAVEVAMQLDSDDPDQEHSFVDLVGTGTGPWLQLSPMNHDFGGIQPSCDASVEVSLQNMGDAKLLVSDIATTNPDGAWTLSDLPDAPFSLDPSAYVVGSMRFLPLTAGPIEWSVDVTSDDSRGVVSASFKGAGEQGLPHTTTWKVPNDPPVDVLFAIDRSCSMLDDAERLADNFSGFIKTVADVTNDWHIGVVTQDAGCFNEGVLTTRTPNYTDRFRTAVSTGKDEDIINDEALFTLAYRALEQLETCNKGFRRPEAALHIVVVSDEPERSPDRVAYQTWDWFVDRWKPMVISPGLLKISGVVDIEGCADGAEGYSQAIEATAGQAFSVCDTNWADAATSLAKASLAETFRIKLDVEPVPDSVEIMADGELWTGAWHLDTTTNEVVLDDQPPEGVTFVVRYIEKQSC
jgi:hypothetical protein